MMKPGARFTSSRRRSLRPGRARSLLCVLVLSLALAGCEWSDWGFGIGTGFHASELRGRYDGTFRIEWEDRRGFGWDQGPGTIWLFGGSGSRIDGEWSWRLGSRRFSGRVRRGRTDFDRLTFSLETRGGRDLLEVLTDCRFLRGDRLFRGGLAGRTLHVVRTVRLRCHDLRTGRSEDVILHISFQGRR